LSSSSIQAQKKISSQIIYVAGEDLFENEVAFVVAKMTLVSVVEEWRKVAWADQKMMGRLKRSEQEKCVVRRLLWWDGAKRHAVGYVQRHLPCLDDALD
jgi:hypothetical protein